MCNVRVCKVMVRVCKVMLWVCKVMVRVWKVMVRVCKVMVQPWMAVSVRGCRGAAVPTSVPLLPVDRSVCVLGGAVLEAVCTFSWCAMHAHGRA